MTTSDAPDRGALEPEASAPAAVLPLAGVRVIDLSTSYAGPSAGMFLGDMGADVVKVERPVTGDDARSWGPPFLGTESAWFLSANRNKRSVCLDVRNPDGLAALLGLVDGADVFIQNLNPSKLRAAGLHPDDLTERNTSLVYCAISGFGLDGPSAGQAGYDLIAQARSGIMSVTGPAGGAPQRVSTALSDIVAGMLVSFAVSAALLRRTATGEGEVIDVSLLESDLALMAPRIASYLAGEPEPTPSGGTDSVIAIYQRFDTADQPVVLAVGNDRMWQRCCSVLDLPDLAADPALATNAGRRELRSQVVEKIAERMASEPARVWLERFAAARVPCQPVQSLSQVVSDPQVIARGSIGEYAHETAGVYRAVRAPWRLASVDRGLDRPAPVLGAHTVEVLRESGMEPAEIARLLETGAAWASPDLT